MKKFLLNTALLISCSFASAQVKQGRDTVMPAQKPVNAGFDVIIKKNGDLLYGLVKMVGQDLITYQRTDIPDGPLYTVSRNDVYAISYRNQVKEIINPLRDSVVHDTVVIHQAVPAMRDTTAAKPADTVAVAVIPPSKNDPFMARRNLSHGNLRIGLGFLRSYTKVSQAGQYSSYLNFPVFSVAYDVRYNDQVRFGLQVAYGHHKFKGEQYSTYDSTQTNATLNEYIFMVDAYARYDILYHTSKLQPYIIGGIGVHSSHINNQYDIAFINDANHNIQVRSGNNSIGIGLIGRIGADYAIDRGTRVFADVGFGPSVFSIGASLRID